MRPLHRRLGGQQLVHEVFAGLSLLALQGVDLGLRGHHLVLLRKFLMQGLVPGLRLAQLLCRDLGGALQLGELGLCGFVLFLHAIRLHRVEPRLPCAVHRQAHCVLHGLLLRALRHLVDLLAKLLLRLFARLPRLSERRLRRLPLRLLSSHLLLALAVLLRELGLLVLQSLAHRLHVLVLLLLRAHLAGVQCLMLGNELRLALFGGLRLGELLRELVLQRFDLLGNFILSLLALLVRLRVLRVGVRELPL
mmetsp:Transcript_11423/g.32921  ORF Transcript_11423/g.32921 Transcript_11423/m.32921 type:complete len:250 (+) Transcript_11423:995-1744(+)